LKQASFSQTQPFICLWTTIYFDQELIFPRFFNTEVLKARQKM